MADNWQLKAVISANAESMVKALKTVNAMSKDTRKYLSDVASSAGKLSGKIGLPFAALSGLIAGFGVSKIKDAVQGFGEMGEAIYKGSLRAGMSVEQYQRMKYVADQAGVGVETLEGSMGKLNKNIGMAAAGKSKDLSALFTKLGVTTRGANGELKSGLDILPDLADAFVRNTNPVTQARMGMALFGKSWQEVVPLLMEGSEGIKESTERMKRLKGVMGAEDINGAREFGKTMKDMDIVLKGFSNTIAKALVPVLQPMIKDLVAWFAANKQIIAADVSKMAKDLAKYLKTVDFKAILQGIGDLLKGLGSFVDMVGGAKNALIALVLYMNIETIMACAGLVVGIGKVGWSLVAMTVKATAGAGGLATLTTAMAAAQTTGLGLLATLGQLAAAAAVGYGVGTLLNDYVINPAVQKMTGDKNASLGTAIYDMFHDDPSAAPPKNERRSDKSAAPTFNNRSQKPLWMQPPQDGPGQSLIAPQAKGRVDGQVNININGLPPGSRVEQPMSGGNMPIKLDAGYSSFATGMP